VVLICPLILFVDNFIQIHYAARPNSSTSFPTLSFDQKTKWLIEYLASRTHCGQQNTRSSSYHCSGREACQTSWNLIDAGKPAPQASPPSDCTPPSDKSFAISSPFHTLPDAFVSFCVGSIYDHWPFCLYIAGHILVEVDQYIMCFGTILGWDTDPDSFVSGEKVRFSFGWV